jgi:hypothetical protein
VQPEPEPLFAESLDAVLQDEELQHSLGLIRSDRIPDPVAAVRADVVAMRDAILEETKAHHDARAKACTQWDEVRLALHRLDVATRLAGWLTVGSLVVISLVIVVFLFVGGRPAWLFTAAFFPVAAGFYCWLPLAAARDNKRRSLRFEDREREREALEHRYETVLNNEITSAIRRAINGHLRSFSTEFEIFDKRGLRELADPQREVPTEANAQLRTLMTSLAGGSLGISGPRGCGKTTLIDSFATGRSVLPNAERRGLVVSAPVRYDAREFILHLYARVCQQVLNPQGTVIDIPRRVQLRAARRKGLAKLLFLSGVVFLVAGATMLLSSRTTPHGPRETGWFLVVTGALTAYGAIFMLPNRDPSRSLREQLLRSFGLVLSGFGGSKNTQPPDTPRFKPELLAEQSLEEIRFQQTLASGWSATFGLPLGSKLGGESTLTLARAPWTLPEVVDEFRSYVQTLTRTDPGEAGTYLVVGIDELDKIDDQEDAQRFLNDIKGVFGVRGCYYLISVSEDAMSNFERRGMPFRDVFDSSFDAIMRVRHLELPESRDVLESRVTGLPVPYQCLCHVLAGGLPRELVRVTRELVHQQEASKNTTMNGLCRAVIASELRAKIDAVGHVARSSTAKQRDFILAWVQRHDVQELDEEVLRERFRELALWPSLMGAATDGDADRRLAALALELMVFEYYATTVLEFFGDEPALKALLSSEIETSDLSPRATAAMETLARARQQFAMSPLLAAGEVTAFRNVTKLDAWNLPKIISAASASDGRVLADSGLA